MLSGCSQICITLLEIYFCGHREKKEKRGQKFNHWIKLGFTHSMVTLIKFLLHRDLQVFVELYQVVMLTATIFTPESRENSKNQFFHPLPID